MKYGDFLRMVPKNEAEKETEKVLHFSYSENVDETESN